MARKANYSASVLSEAAAGRRLPTLAVTLAYVRACGGDPEDWRARWTAMSQDAGSPETGSPVPEPEEPGPEVPEPPATGSRSNWSPRTVVQFVSALAGLLAALAVLVVVVRYETPTTAKGAGRQQSTESTQTTPTTLPRARTAEGAPADGAPAEGLPCSDLIKARACVDVTRRLFWVKDVPPSDGHHTAVYWSVTGGGELGECHNYLQADGPWCTCAYPELGAGAALTFQVAVVEKETVLEWGPRITLP